jgi:Ca2+-binding EF-hand superfamily protein
MAAKLPPCQPKHAQLFLSPMGEPLRAGPNEPYPSARWFAQADSNHDGKLTLAEMIANADRFFQILDRDHDGEITPPENRYYEDEIAPEIRSQLGRVDDFMTDRPKVKRSKHAQAVPEGAGRWSSLAIPQPVIAADADMNRAVTRAEFRAAAEERFGRLDPQKRGYLTLDTLPKPPAQVAAEAPCSAVTGAK